MTDIFTQRGAGDKRGDDVVDPLITSTPVAIQRGRNELDKQAHSPRDVEVETVYRTGVRLGQVAKFYDSQTGLEWLGKIVGISHHFSVGDDGEVSRYTRLQVEKPTILV